MKSKMTEQNYYENAALVRFTRSILSRNNLYPKFSKADRHFLCIVETRSKLIWVRHLVKTTFGSLIVPNGLFICHSISLLLVYFLIGFCKTNEAFSQLLVNAKLENYLAKRYNNMHCIKNAGKKVIKVLGRSG